jgi:DNA-3-methyladenine glycosylase II
MARGAFELEPVSPFRLDLTAWALRRRSHNAVDRWDGATYRRVLPLPAGPVEVAVTQVAPPEQARLRVAVAGQPASAAVRVAVTAALDRLLGLSIDLTDFYRFAARDRRLGPLVQRFRGMKPPRFATLFEALINAMACQQVTLTLGILLLNRLAEATGGAFGKGDEVVHAFPRPAELAGLSPASLRQLGFSRQKGRAMTELARSVSEGRLDLEMLAGLPDDEAVDRLCELRGVGRWSAEYVLLRGLGRTRVFPGDDVGARNNLQRWLRLPRPIDYPEARRVLARWKGYAGLVYFHLLLDRLEQAGSLDDRPDARTTRAATRAAPGSRAGSRAGPRQRRARVKKGR